jgi:hypothetical protein
MAVASVFLGACIVSLSPIVHGNLLWSVDIVVGSSFLACVLVGAFCGLVAITCGDKPLWGFGGLIVNVLAFLLTGLFVFRFGH